MVSKASEDLPEPDKPVITTSRSRGRATSMPFKLCSRAPRTRISWTSGGASLFLDFMPSSALRRSPVDALEYGAGDPEMRDLRERAPDKISRLLILS
jgi:hypothetical protein